MFLSRSFLLVAGCSHTEGAGVDPQDIWAQQVADDLNWDVVNLGKSGACASFVSQQLKSWLLQSQNTPSVVVVQWPNPYRSMEIKDGQLFFYNVHSSNDQFHRRMKNDPNSFWNEWIESIVETNEICKIPLINVCLESKDLFSGQLEHLRTHGIELHVDEKVPGKTWYFDSKGSDGIHHSAQCHRKWADRILTLLNDRL